MSAITKFLPRRSLSRWVGQLVHWRGPVWWAELSVRAFAWIFNINLGEAEKPYTEYPSIGEFFVRRLKPGVRPVGNSWAVHPADSRITQFAPMDNGTLIQAKGLTYRLKDFTQDPDCEKKWAGGCFLTYYLCPTDYHRVHSPVEGNITDVRYIPGDLWPVNKWSTTHVKNLFSKNERVLVEIQTDLGPVGVVFVGATNVGSIALTFDESIQSNQRGRHNIKHKYYSPEIPIQKGAELGMFRMGSTVVMLYPPMFRKMFEKDLDLGPVVRVNAALVR